MLLPQNDKNTGPSQGSSSGTISGTEISTIIDQNPINLITRRSGVSNEFDPGDLGSIQLTNTETDFLRQTNRIDDFILTFPSFNHRKRGERESFKFNILIQKILASAAYVFHTLRSKDQSLTLSELNTGPQFSSTPDQSEIALICHINAQLLFKEWLILKDPDIRWFNP